MFCIVLTVALGACGASRAAAPGSAPPAPTAVSAWGDSLTQGMGASSWETYYPSDLAVLARRVVINNGIAGQTSRSIAARQGGVPALLTFDGNTLLPGTANLVRYDVAPLTRYGPPGGVAGSVQGIAGTLIGADATSAALAFVPVKLAAPLGVLPGTPFVPDTEAQRDNINVLWMGRNNFHEVDQVVADVAACIRHVRGGKVIVLSVINGAGEGVGTGSYQEIVDLNRRLAALPGAVYIDIRAMLVAAYDPQQPQDLRDHLLDIPPGSLRSDGLHYNDAGYRLVATAVAQAIRQQGW